MRVERLVVGPLDNNCWLVSDDAGGPLVVIDPAAEPDEVLRAVGSRSVATIVLTHGHFDHLQAVEALQTASHAPLAIHVADAYRLGSSELTGGRLFGFEHSPLTADRVLEDGDLIEAGGATLLVLHTPGHTEGGICLYAEGSAGDVGHLFSGDTLFAGSVGRSDFAGGDARTLADSIAKKLVGLPDDTRVHPGHGPDTTIGRERLVNPFFPRA